MVGFFYQKGLDLSEWRASASTSPPRTQYIRRKEGVCTNDSRVKGDAHVLHSEARQIASTEKLPGSGRIKLTRNHLSLRQQKQRRRVLDLQTPCLVASPARNRSRRMDPAGWLLKEALSTTIYKIRSITSHRAMAKLVCRNRCACKMLSGRQHKGGGETVPVHAAQLQ